LQSCAAIAYCVLYVSYGLFTSSPFPIKQPQTGRLSLECYSFPIAFPSQLTKCSAYRVVTLNVQLVGNISKQSAGCDRPTSSRAAHSALQCSRKQHNNMLFLAWLAVSFIVVTLINIYLRYFGLPRRIVSSDGRVLSSGTSPLTSSTIPTHQGESAQWINNILTWISQQGPGTRQRSEVIDAWLKSLTEEAQHYSVNIFK